MTDDFIGQEIGWLKVLNKQPVVYNSKRNIYRCRCKCGDIAIYEKNRLMQGCFPACSFCMSDPDNEEILNSLAQEIKEKYTNEIDISSENIKSIMKTSKRVKNRKNSFELSDEQNLFIEKALEGHNILVDACIGSGKTTAIQALCDTVSSDKNILYLTYNRLLKADAKKKIHNKNVTVTNYHGYASMVLRRVGITCGVSDLIQTFIKMKPIIDYFDMLIIDEYQDIDKELADMLLLIKEANPSMQIVAVGDMEQKIYDKTILDVHSFIDEFLGKHLDLQFTNCFRLSKDLAAMLGRVWGKEINGTNDKCIVERMGIDKALDFLSKQKAGDVLCLGRRNGDISFVLNQLEYRYPEKFSKKNVYASIRDSDGKLVEPKSNTAIFTTFDSSKGLERPVCVVFDFTEKYWDYRAHAPLQKYTILRNIFCVAASRGKNHIIFVERGDKILSEETLSTPISSNNRISKVAVSEMFDFKYKEDVERCYEYLQINKRNTTDESVIYIKENDEMIDLSPCVGIYQEASYFEKYDIDFDIKMHLLLNPHLRHLYTDKIKNGTIEEKILFLTSLETQQNRYMTQVDLPFVTPDQTNQIHRRLSELLSADEDVQAECNLEFQDENGECVFTAIGRADVVKEETVYELKFVTDIRHEHFLQCAIYMLGLGLEKGVLWNVKNNSVYEIKIQNVDSFKKQVIKTITMGSVDKKENNSLKLLLERNKHYDFSYNQEMIAVIDTETNYNDQVMSIGIVILNSDNMEPIESGYYIINPEYKKGGMYSSVLKYKDTKDAVVTSRQEAIDLIIKKLEKNNVNKLFAYNASFDFNHLPELNHFSWFDIMKLAANINYNHSIPDNAEIYKNGRLKKGYRVEDIMRMLNGNRHYREIHNAYYDAIDELKIMKLLGCSIIDYRIAEISRGKEVFPKKHVVSENDIIESFNRAQEEQSGINNIEKRDEVNIATSIKTRDSIDGCNAIQAAEMIGVSKSTIYNMIKRGDLSAAMKDGKWCIDVDSINDYLQKKDIEDESSASLYIALSLLSAVVLAMIYYGGFRL